MTTGCHSLSLVVLIVVTQCTTRISFYKYVNGQIIVTVDMMKNYLPSTLRWNLSFNISNILKVALLRNVEIIAEEK